MPRASKEKKYERKRRKCTFTLSDQARNFLANNVTNASRFIDELIKGAEKGIQPAIVTVSPIGVGSLRFELRTSAMSRRRHNQLDHEPDDQ